MQKRSDGLDQAAPRYGPGCYVELEEASRSPLNQYSIQYFLLFSSGSV